MRALDYAATATRDLRRQKVRSGLTLLALVISTTVLVTMAALSIGGRDAIVTQFSTDAESMLQLVVTPNSSSANLGLYGNVQEVNEQASKLDDAAVQKIAGIDKVVFTQKRAFVWEFKQFSVEGSQRQFVANTSGVSSYENWQRAAGNTFTIGEHRTAEQVILGHSFARELGFADKLTELLGKTITITTQKGYRGYGADITGPEATTAEVEAYNDKETVLTAEIVGITTKNSDQNSLLIDMEWAKAVRALNYWEYDPVKASYSRNAPIYGDSLYNPGTGLDLKLLHPEYVRIGKLNGKNQIEENGYSTILVKAQTVDDVDSVMSAIKALGYGVTSTKDQLKRVQQITTVMWVILGSVAVIALVSAALGVVNTMLMTVSEQRYAIGVWRAVGATRGLISRLILLEAAILGLIGGAMGAGLGVVISTTVNKYLSSLLQEQGLDVVNIALTPPWLLVGAILLTAIFGVLAGLYPAIRASRQDPSIALSSGG